MIKVGIVGATGCAGEELISILLNHPNVRITNLSAEVDRPQSIAEIFPKFKNRFELICSRPDIKEIAEKCDLVFLALPHTISMGIAPDLLKAGKKVIDLSADYRLDDLTVYQEFYKVKHKDKLNLKQAVYGLPEIYRDTIKKAGLVANPGCYPTAAILALAPLVALNIADMDSIIIDAKSGVTGAGRKVAEDFLFSQINEDFKAYKVNVHQHMPEINQVLSKLTGRKINVVFVPHLLPLNRGILETIYINRGQGPGARGQDLIKLYKEFYKNEPFVRIKNEGIFPRLREVVGSNFCDIGIREGAQNIIIVAVIDNLLKGASGQAVQNMNVLYAFPETMGLL